MKAARAYLGFAVGWALALLCAYYGWGQGYAPAKHVYHAWLFLGAFALFVIGLLSLFFLTVSDEKLAALPKKPKPVDTSHFTPAFSLVSLTLKLFLFAWFGAVWAGIATFALGIAAMFIVAFHNAVIADRNSP